MRLDLESGLLIAGGLGAAGFILYSIAKRDPGESIAHSVGEDVAHTVSSTIVDTVGGVTSGLVSGVAQKVLPWSPNNIVYHDVVTPIVETLPNSGKGDTLGTKLFDWTHDAKGQPTNSFTKWFDSWAL